MLIKRCGGVWSVRFQCSACDRVVEVDEKQLFMDEIENMVATTCPRCSIKVIIDETFPSEIIDGLTPAT